MKKSFFSSVLGVFLLLVSPLSAIATDARQKIEMPPMMQEHMLNNMRDHLRALQEIQAALAKSDFDKAADIAEQRIGMSSLENARRRAHGALYAEADAGHRHANASRRQPFLAHGAGSRGEGQYGAGAG